MTQIFGRLVLAKVPSTYQINPTGSFYGWNWARISYDWCQGASVTEAIRILRAMFFVLTIRLSGVERGAVDMWSTVSFRQACLTPLFR